MTETREIGNTETISLQNVSPISKEPSEESNEINIPNIPISLLQEIVEEGEHSVINPQLESSIDETNMNNLSDTSLSLPSEYLQSFDSIFSLGSEEFLLNNCGQKRLIVGLTSSSIPNLKIVFKLHDMKNNYCTMFSKKEWNTIIQHEMVIVNSMINNFEEQICYSDHIRIETLILYNRPCVKFCDIADNHCTLALETFQHMMLLRHEIEESYNNLKNGIKDVTKRLKLFMDVTFFLLFKSNNIDYRHNYNRLMLFMNKSSNFLDLSSSVAHTWKELGEWIAKESIANVHEL